MPIASGQVVNGRYRIIRQLGQGGFGAVYLAHDLNLDRPCALKENLETSSEVMRQFVREAQLLANLSHPNLPRVIDHFVLAGQGQYLVMDYVEGEDLQEMLERTAQPLPTAEALGWVGQVCDALSYLHHHEPPIIHRDIKPGNIRITPRGQAMLVDFGIAKLYDSQTHTTAGARAFTPGYSPPEQYGKGATDQRSDIYALGATLYSLLTSSTPPDSVDLMTGNAPALPPAHLVNPRVPRPVSIAIARAMKSDRPQRFQSVDELKTALLAGSAPVAQAEVTGQKPQPRSREGAFRTLHWLITPGRSAASGARRGRAWSPGPMLKIAAAGLAVVLLALLTAFAIVRLTSRSSAGPLASGELRPASPPESSGAIATQASSPPSGTPRLTDTPIAPAEAGAILVDFPAARIAFSSDHAGDQKDRIYVQEFQPGSYWLAPLSNMQYQLASSNPVSPVSEPVAIPIDENQERAWWPEWCDGNRTILFEGGDQQSEKYQTIYSVAYDPTDFEAPTPIRWDGFVMLGVPRCANRSNLVTATARRDLDSDIWLLHRFDLNAPARPTLVGDGYPAFGGNVSYSGDDSWSVLMHKDAEYDQIFRLLQIIWEDVSQPVSVPNPSSIYSAMYPSISPTSGAIAYACQTKMDTRREAGAWGLCIQEINGQGFRLLDQAGTTLGQRKDYNRFHVFTPSWSNDGRWIAYASPKDGDWDVYLYLLERDIEINLTQKLGGDQFDPVWSKASAPAP